MYLANVPSTSGVGTRGVHLAGPVDGSHAVTNPQQTEHEVDVAPVEELLRLMEKGVRAIQLYLPNNPMYTQALDSVRRGFAPIWKVTTDLTLRVKNTGFEWEGVELNAAGGRDNKDSLAWVLYKDGIRAITLAEGVEEDEVVRFLAVLNRVRSLPADAEDDLLTLLWGEEFYHLQYMYVELGFDDVPALQASSTFGESAPAEDVRRQVEEEVKDEAVATEEPPPGIARIDDFDSTLYFLDDSEVKHVTEELQREYKQDLRANVIAMLFDILEQYTYGEARAQVVETLEHLIPHILGANDFAAVALLLRESRDVLKRMPDLEPELRERMDGLPARLSQPEVLSQVLQTLDDAHVLPSEADLGELFKALRAEAMNTVLSWLPRLNTEAVRDLLERAADPLAQYHPDAVAEALSSEDRDVLLGALRLATRHNLQSVSGKLGHLLDHADPEIRTALVGALAAVTTPTSLQHLRQMMEDKDRDVRIAAVKAMAAKRHRLSFPQIEAAVKGRILKGSDLTEKRAFFEAYGLLAGDGGVEFLAGLLNPKGLLKKKWDPETRACAAMALGKLAKPEARAALESVRDDKEPLVRNAVINALREVGR